MALQVMAPEQLLEVTQIATELLLKVVTMAEALQVPTELVLVVPQEVMVPQLVEQQEAMERKAVTALVPETEVHLKQPSKLNRIRKMDN